MSKKWTPSGLFVRDKEGCMQAAEWWRSRGYEVKVSKVKDGWKHYRRKK